MSDWASYRLQDFIPFTAEVYFRLLERMGEAFWPLQLLTLALGGVVLLLALKSRTRLACLLLAPLWVFVAVACLGQRYAELNWAGGYIGHAFFAQAFLLALIALIGRRIGKPPHGKSPPLVAGVGIALFGLIGQPLMAPLSGGSWYQAELFGVHPDPTAITTLGLALVALRGGMIWAAATIPALWILLSGLTLLVLDASRAVPLFAVLAIGMLGLVWKGAVTCKKVES